LNFALPDVLEMSQKLTGQQDKLAADPKLKRYEQTQVIRFTDADATSVNVRAALERFAEGDQVPVPAGLSGPARDEFSKIKEAQPEDAVVIYYAGHGVIRDDRFYLLTHDFARDEHVGYVNAISDADLNQLLEKVDAGKLLMVIDACQSGQALGGLDEGRGPMNSKGLAQLAYDKGMLILTASLAEANETDTLNGKKIGHGFLTYALLQAFADPKADRDQDGKITDREWVDYAVGAVPELDELKGTPHRGSEEVDKPKASHLPPQTPRVFYRRDNARDPLVVAVRGVAPPH
jgi:uncharacterized caspase-like protein